nr:reverse transcriptase domain-containing protein [Tanacetum cinerariifolium]
MSTRSTAKNLFPPLDNLELTIQRRYRVDPTLLNEFEMAAEGNGGPPVPDLRTMKELCQPSLNGRGGPIAPIAIQAMNFGLKNDMIQQVRILANFMDFWEIVALKAKMAEINKKLMKVLQINQQVKAVNPSCEPYGGPHSYNDCPATIGQTQNIYAAGAYQGGNSYQPQGTLPSNTITNQKEDLKGITTRSGTAYQAPTIPTTSSSLPKVVECETKVTKDAVPLTNNGSTKDVQPPVVQTETPVPNSKPVIAPVIEPVVAPVSAPKPNLKPSIPYPSRLYDQNLRDKTNDQKEKFFKIFQDLNFNISLEDDLILMPKFGPTIKSMLTNKEKLYELAKTLLNEHCSAVLLKKLPKKLGDPDKFLISRDFPKMNECLALADLGASINLMPLFAWNKISLPKLTPTLMTLELADRSISRPISVAEDVFVKVGRFHFSAEFVVVDFDADPRVPLILGRSFLKTEKDLINVYEGELTLRVGKEAITFNLDQTLRCSANYNDMTANRIDIIDMACEEYSQEVLGFSDVIASGNPTPYYDPIVSTSSPNLTPFGDSDFLLEEVDAFLALEDDATSLKFDHSYYDPKGDILLLEAFLNDGPSLPPPNQGMCLPQVLKELKIYEAKSSIDEPPEVELKDLPPYLEYVFLEGDDNLPVIIAKDLSVKEKATLLKVLKSYKQAIAWKLSDIKATHKDHFPLPFMDQMLERLAGNEYYCFLDGFSGYFQIPINPKDQEKTTFTCPYGTFVYRRMPFGLCNAPGTFQRCMMAIFHDMIEKRWKSLWTASWFGTPRAIISDYGTYFCNDQFAKVMLKYGVTHCLATTYHPQTSGQLEVSNRGLKRILERIVGKNHASWSDRLDDAL